MKKRSIKTELPLSSQATLEWAVVGNDTLYTAQIPIDKEGKVVDGGIEAQILQTMKNLLHTLDAAGLSTEDVFQVLIYVTDRDYLKVVNRVYADYFTAPYPNRAAIIVAGLAREEMLVELVVYANANTT